eukprot:TRINITY_DN5124_c1_g1_i3.p2 TRINITY_DN5124_c1_g1~~TRINITY_DN5124_c1_g1_i3.p2  ORF type:complete len:134 (-),score=6.33 TRINITY_DN5124_c1_g1_i3:356-757(-)
MVLSGLLRMKGLRGAASTYLWSAKHVQASHQARLSSEAPTQGLVEVSDTSLVRIDGLTHAGFIINGVQVDGAALAYGHRWFKWKVDSIVTCRCICGDDRLRSLQCAYTVRRGGASRQLRNLRISSDRAGVQKS